MLKKFEVALGNGSKDIRWSEKEDYIRIFSHDHKDIVAIEELQRNSIADLPDDFRDRLARHFVIEHMSYNGQYKSLIKTIQIWQKIYLMGDGFDNMTRERANDQDWDWSHVRDSSTIAFLQMANYIWQELWGHKDSVIYDHCANMVGQCVLGGIDPLLLLD